MATKNSYLTVTDQFCGAGGSSIGAVGAGVELKLAMNHWQLAIETHNSNFPNALHDCADISATNPKRYPATDILITSPECTNHSLAKGVKRKKTPQLNLFGGKATLDPAAERSRATMWDVPRFAEEHRYNIIIVENVVDARYWELWDAWLHAMDLLGYNHHIVYFNSMFAHPTPQSRDRMYVVFWRKGNRAPNLDFRPRAYCPRCERDIEGVQSWKKKGTRWGRYKKQYIYVCPTCAQAVEPYYFCAANAIDWSLPAPRIGDRERPLKEKTMARIEAGLEKFAIPFLYDSVHTARDGRHQDMVWPVSGPGRTQIGLPTHGLIVPPFTVETGYSHSGNNRNYVASDALVTQTTRQTLGLVVPPFVYNYYGNEFMTSPDEGMPTITGIVKQALIVPPFIMSMNHSDIRNRPVSDGVATVMPHVAPGLVVPPYIVNMQADNAPTEITEPLPTQLTGDHRYLVMPFIVSYYTRTTGNRAALTSIDESLPTIPTWAVHYVAQPGEKPTADDCGFRMLQPHEIQRAMAFPNDYVVLGATREKVKLLGNAVTPPVMRMLMERCVETFN